MKNLQIERKADKLLVSYNPILNGLAAKLFEIAKISEDAWPVTFYTATSNMSDFIGNVKKIQGRLCEVEGVIYGKMGVVTKVLIADSRVSSQGERVMVTEWLDLDGKLVLIATKNRILCGNLNFINVGWSNNKECQFIRIDPYFANSKRLTCGPINGNRK